MLEPMKLYSFFRSSSAFRVRIALNLKGIGYELVAVDLSASEQLSEDYRQHNPQALVPAIELEDGTVLSQSIAILEWLEETVPEPALLPGDVGQRAFL